MTNFASLRYDWTLAEIETIYTAPVSDLIFRAQQIQRAYHRADEVQGCVLLSIKTGGCPEDCAYCPQSAHYSTGVAREDLVSLDQMREAAVGARAQGATRFGMGEGRTVRYGLLRQLAALDPHPESVPINLLVRVAGTPLGDLPPEDPFELVRTIATARILMPESIVRLSAGRLSLTDEAQALCFLAGANSVFLGDRLLTTPNPGADVDRSLFERLGIRLQASYE